MSLGQFTTPQPQNETVRDYAPGSAERASIESRLEKMAHEPVDVPVFIGDSEIRTGREAEIRSPHRRSQVLGQYHPADGALVEKAIEAAREAWRSWSATPWEERAAIFLKAADLLAGSWRDVLNGATMLCQSKTVYQAEIDSACELIDFWRFNVHYMRRLYEEQPLSPRGVWNRMEYRPLEGFVFAATPFNFTAIAGNLPTAPAMLGNTVVWKPASSTVYSAYHIMRILQQAGLPPGVINMVPGPGAAIGDPVLASEHLAGIHFTGSTGTFQGMWQTIGRNIARYKSYPRIVGETGGKDFVVVHASAEVEAVVAALVRGAFEFQGQKCSAASRAYVPRSLWTALKSRLLAEVETIKVGDVADFRNFMGAVIDRAAFDRISEYLDYARTAPGAHVLCGGRGDAAEGYFIQPTVVQVDDPQDRLMREEIFGPVLSVYAYDDGHFEKVLDLCDATSPYGLTGAVFATDRGVLSRTSERLRYAAGNFYINDKPTGAVVGQQPFGGARASGTNDKAGSILNLMRWVSPRAIKETFSPPRDYRYPFMAEA